MHWSELVEIEIAGPGNVTRGGGFIGGGFGIEGAAEGMLIASVLNAVTTRSSVQTILGLLFRHQELWLLRETLEPLALRIEMAPVYAPLRPRGTLHSKRRSARDAAHARFFRGVGSWSCDQDVGL